MSLLHTNASNGSFAFSVKCKFLKVADKGRMRPCLAFLFYFSPQSATRMILPGLLRKRCHRCSGSCMETAVRHHWKPPCIDSFKLIRERVKESQKHLAGDTSWLALQEVTDAPTAQMEVQV